MYGKCNIQQTEKINALSILTRALKTTPKDASEWYGISLHL